MKLISIDGINLNSIDEIHWVLKNKLELPEYYGNNLDALWDCLTGWVELPLTIEWVNFELSKQRLGEYVKKLEGMFREAEIELEGFKLVLK